MRKKSFRLFGGEDDVLFRCERGKAEVALVRRGMLHKSKQSLSRRGNPALLEWRLLACFLLFFSCPSAQLDSGVVTLAWDFGAFPSSSAEKAAHNSLVAV